MKTSAVLCLLLLAPPVFAAAPPPACDRECLRGLVTQVGSASSLQELPKIVLSLKTARIWELSREKMAMSAAHPLVSH